MTQETDQITTAITPGTAAAGDLAALRRQGATDPSGFLATVIEPAAGATPIAGRAERAALILAATIPAPP